MQLAHRVEFEAFRLDPQDARLWRGQDAIPLHPKTFAVLCCLVQQAGQLVTKDALLAAVWPETVVSEAVITAAVQELRRALGDQARTPRFVETVYSRGYRFLAPVRAVTSPGVEGREAVALPVRPPRASRPQYFVGREAELAQLGQWWATVQQGQRQIGFIVGEPGMGKTALVDAFVADVSTTEDIWVGHGQCIDHYGAGEAYLPVLEALGRLGRGPQGATLTAVLQQYAPSWLVHLPALLTPEEQERLAPTVRGVTPDRMLRELAEALDVLTASRPLVLVLEDLHWSDHATLAWLAYMVRRRDVARLLIVGTYRPVDVIVRAHPLRSLMTELRRHPQCAELILDYLSATAVTAYLRQRFGASPVPSDVFQSLYQRTGGNPLFLTVLVDYWVTQGWLVEVEGRWTCSAGLPEFQGSIPVSLWQMIETQLDRLSAEEQQVLEVGSVAGVAFSAAAVAAGCADEVMRSDERCSALVRRSPILRGCGELVWPDGTVAGCYAFVHALYHEVLYSRLTAARRVFLHQQIGRCLEAAYGTQAGDIAGELARHFERGRDAERAVQYLQRAGEQALWRSAHLEALSHLTKGLDILQTLPDTPAQRQRELTLQITLGPVLIATRGYAAPEVEHVYARAHTLCQQVGETPQRFSALLGLVGFYQVRGPLRTAQELAEQLLVLAQSAEDTALRVVAHCALGNTLSLLGELAAARTHLAQSWTLYHAQKPAAHGLRYGLDPGVSSLANAAWTLWLLGYPEQGRACCQEMLRLAHELAHPFSLAHALNYAAGFSQYCREASAVHEHAEALHTLATAQGFRHLSATAQSMRGWALVAQGHVVEGITQMRHSLTARQATAAPARARFLVHLAEAYGSAGLIEEGLTTLTDALAMVDTMGERYHEAEAYRLKGALLVQRTSAQAPEAEACFQQALTVARRQQARALELRAALSLSRLWQSQGKRDAARQVLTSVYDWFTEGFDTPDLQEARALLEALA